MGRRDKHKSGQPPNQFGYAAIGQKIKQFDFIIFIRTSRIKQQMKGPAK